METICKKEKTLPSPYFSFKKVVLIYARKLYQIRKRTYKLLFVAYVMKGEHKKKKKKKSRVKRA